MQYNYESQNLIYQILLEDDAPKMLNFYEANKSIFEPYEPDKPDNFYTLEYQVSLAKFEHECFMRGKAARYWISRKTQPDILIGSVNFNNIIKGSFQSCNVGYKIHKNHQRLGYATEAVTTLTQHYFESGTLHRIEAYIHPQNLPSVSLAEKCGFVFDGVAREFVMMKGVWVDHLRYTLISKG